MRRAFVVAAVFAAALVVAIPASHAGSVSVSVSAPKELNFVAENGETNAVDLLYPENYNFYDWGAELTAGAGCVSLGPNSAQCDFRNVNAYLGDGDDTGRVVWDGRVRVWAGSGNDTVVGDSYANWAEVYGEAGDDTITAGGEGNQLADGGPGNDVVHAGGFAGHGTGIGGPGNDTITFRAYFYGPATLEGGTGNDTITSNPASGTAAGGNGNDTIVIEGDPPFFRGDSGFVITGGQGNDTIKTDQFPDTVDGGTGDDYIDVRGGGADTVTCGAGNDVVLYDASDTVSGDCETSSLS